MDNQTETDSAPRTKKSLGWLWWSLLGVGLYILDQVSKLWIIHRFPLNYVDEHTHKYAHIPGFPGFQHIHAGGIIDFFTNGPIPAEDMARYTDLNQNSVNALNRLRDLEPITFLDGMVNITRVHNTGVAFGLGNGTAWSSYVFLGIPVLAIIALIVLYRKTFPYGMAQACLRAPAGGRGRQSDGPPRAGLPASLRTAARLFTKLLNGYVVDFIDVTLPVINYRWPAFNVADSCIFVAAIIFFIASIFSSRSKEETPS